MNTTSRHVVSADADKAGKAIRVAIYARLSKDPTGLSVNTGIQVYECVEGIKHYASELGLPVEVVVIFEENDIGASVYSKKERADFNNLIRLIEESGVDILFVTEVERLVRQSAEAEQLIELARTTNLREIRLAAGGGYVLSSPDGIYRFRKDVNLAERESRKTSERLRRKQAARARSGLSHGSRRCFGYKSGNIEIDEAEAAILREMGSRLLAGSSFKEIAYWANERGYKTAEGKMWYPVTIRNSLRRVRYVGIREHHGKQYPAMWPAVFDVATWERMQLNIKARSEKYAGRRKAQKYLLTGLVHCGKCGMPLNGEIKRDNPARPTRAIYYCRVQGDTRKEHGCGGVSINADALNWYIRESVFERLDPVVIPVLMKEGNSDDEKLKQLLGQRAAQQLIVDGLIDDYASGLLDRDEFSRAKGKARAELARIQALIDRISLRKSETGQLTAKESFKKAWDSHEETNWRRQLIGMAVERIDVFPGVRKPYVNVDGVTMRFDKGRVKILWRRVDGPTASAA